jgi:hypothetical protein
MKVCTIWSVVLISCFWSSFCNVFRQTFLENFAVGLGLFHKGRGCFFMLITHCYIAEVTLINWRMVQEELLAQQYLVCTGKWEAQHIFWGWATRWGTRFGNTASLSIPTLDNEFTAGALTSYFCFLESACLLGPKPVCGPSEFYTNRNAFCLRWKTTAILLTLAYSLLLRTIEAISYALLKYLKTLKGFAWRPSFSLVDK